MATRAEAEVYWSSIASACTPDSIAIQGDRYVVAPDNYVTPKPGVLDPIVLICSLPQKQGALLQHVLSMTYLDSTGPSASAKVQAQLIRVQRSNGSRAVVATVASNSFPQTSTVYHKSALFVHPFNFTNFYYYVRIEIDRNASSESVRSLGVALESTCGDGVVSAPEACDDGDTAGGDGCSATCTVEAGYSCTGSPSVCTPTTPTLLSIAVTPTNPSVNVGQTVQFTATGTFSSGPTQDLTATATWSTQPPSIATVANGLATGVSGGVTQITAAVGLVSGAALLQVNPDICGDGTVGVTEACDDGGTISGDGCSSTCTVETGYSCFGSPSVCSGGCGDGVVSGTEVCDDGGNTSGDGCSAACRIESGWQCAGSPSVCTPI